MRDYSLSHLSDAVLLRDLDTLIAQECVTIADVLAHIAEVDARKLYAPAGYRSMFAYCVAVLRFSEDAAGKRIHAARTARQYPVLFKALAEGRLHMTAVCLLAPHLTRKNIGELVEEATYRTKSEIENFLAARYPLPTPPRRTPSAQCELAPELGPRVSEEDPGLPGGCEHAPEHVMLAPTQPEHASEHAASSAIQPEHAPEHAAPSLIQPGPAPEHAALSHIQQGHAPEHAAAHVGNARPTTSPAPLCQVTIR
ncbi:MAG TPA: hypothetical protein VFP10_09995, partial [Candidatus Eisenbacteria bacterium]|nr:hypothetical protein [Candidatus Eisenbacteria bacterium]